MRPCWLVTAYWPCRLRRRGRFFDDEQRPLGHARIDGEHRPLAQKIHGIVAPLALPDLAAIDAEDQRQFPAVEGDDGRDLAMGVGAAGPSPACTSER